MTDPNVIPLNRSQVPGALEIQTERTLPDGTLITFEQAPAGYLKKDGEPRKVDHRAYYIQHPGEKRTRVPSVTTLLNEIVPKDLSWWSEEQGILGMAELVRRGLWNPVQHTGEDAVELVRSHRLGKDAARDRAATRGTDAHSIVEAFLTEGTAPRPQDWPPELHGYIQALTRWILDVKPDPICVEQLVASEAGYAGRVDLLARIDGQVTLVDLKTNVRGMVFTGAHLQTALYRRALYECGDCDSLDIPIRVVVFAASGEYREVAVTVGDEQLEFLLAWRNVLRPVMAACESHNRRVRKALAA